MYYLRPTTGVFCYGRPYTESENTTLGHKEVNVRGIGLFVALGGKYSAPNGGRWTSTEFPHRRHSGRLFETIPLSLVKCYEVPYLIDQSWLTMIITLWCTNRIDVLRISNVYVEVSYDKGVRYSWMKLSSDSPNSKLVQPVSHPPNSEHIWLYTNVRYLWSQKN